ncbi:MAG: hypothetical protein ACXWC1_33660 [Burkholderiales bacterium]
MGLSNVAGVFSRYFIIGFFVPAFAILSVMTQTVDAALIPSAYSSASEAGKAAILGGSALLVALILLGIHRRVLRLYEGYPICEPDPKQNHNVSLVKRILRTLIWPLIRPISKRLIEHQRSIFTKALHPAEKKPLQRFTLDRCFPRCGASASDSDQDEDYWLLPTAFGNAMRASARHSDVRWGLNGVAAWPYIENLLTSQEAQVHADLKGDVAFFVNGSLLSALVAVVFVIDQTAWGTVPWYAAALICAAPVVVGRLAYLAAVDAVKEWGEATRASIDLHRHELYEMLGMRRPVDFSDERGIAEALSLTMLFGDATPDEFAAATQSLARTPKNSTARGSANGQVDPNRRRGSGRRRSATRKITD